MSWIKVETSLYEKTEVFRIAKLLECSRAEALGLLIIFWVWADKNTPDGWLQADADIIDTLTKKGFCSALAKVGWLELSGDKVKLPNYDRHNGSSAKSRAMTAERVRKHRNGKSVTREEKKREDKKKGNEKW